MKTFWPTFLAILAAVFVVNVCVFVKSNIDEGRRVQAANAALDIQTKAALEAGRRVQEEGWAKMKELGYPVPPEFARPTSTPKP
jgi:hypothetical protein